MKLYVVLSVLIVGLLYSCSKEEEASVFKEPIAVLQPSTNPANIVKGAAIKYDIRFTAASQIDSVKVYYRVDTTGTGSKLQIDSLIHYVDYPENEVKNERSINGSFLPYVFPLVGRKIHLLIYLYTRDKNYDKSIPLIVS